MLTSASSLTPGKMRWSLPDGRGKGASRSLSSETTWPDTSACLRERLWCLLRDVGAPSSDAAAADAASSVDGDASDVPVSSDSARARGPAVTTSAKATPKKHDR